MSEVLAIIAIFLSFIAYLPYIYDSLKRNTVPHAFSWCIWGTISLCIFWLQKNGGGGIGSYVTLITALILLCIAFIGFKKGSSLITTLDIGILCSAIMAMVVWYVIDNANIAMAILIGIEMVGFLPTFRKAWYLPHSETLSLFVLTTVQYSFTILALETHTFVTLLNPVSWIIANLLFITMVTLRRENKKEGILLPFLQK